MRARAALLLQLLGCSQMGPRPPVPRVSIDPKFIPEGDGHRTEVAFDGSASADELDDPAAPLEFRWTVDDASRHIVRGGLDEAAVVMTFSGDRVVTATLTVTDPDGLSSSLSARVGLTVDR